MRYLLPLSYLLILTTFFSCKNDNISEDATYFGGEIINPKTNYVLIHKDEVLIDSVALDENNRFIYQFKNFTPGLYHFNHEEYQYVFIEPQDSIIFRLNTIDFDESLTFSGKGAHKNNFIINTFLANERHEVKARKLYKLPAKKFCDRISAELQQRLNMLDMYEERYEFSEDFIEVANAHIKYHYYRIKEQYPRYNKVQVDSIQEDEFYEFRKDIDYDSGNLGSFYPFYEYMYALIDNLSSQKIKQLNTQNDIYVSYNTKVNIIDSLVQNQSAKNQLLKNIALSYLSKVECKDYAQKILEQFKRINTDSKNEVQITKLVTNISRLSKGNNLPSFNVLNLDNETTNIQQLINKPTVIYFWTSKNPRHLKSSHYKAQHFQENSQFDFISISLDHDKHKWVNFTKNKGFKNEYIFETPYHTKEDLLIQNISKVYVIDENAKILSSDLNLFDTKFLEKLNNLE
ncbi:MAG: TlpA family protein disulfide reductase [Flavobacteriaceae bacterium]